MTKEKLAVASSVGKTSVLKIDSKASKKLVGAFLTARKPTELKRYFTLLEANLATPDDWANLFPAAVIGKIVKTWNIDVWNVAAAGFSNHPVQRDTLERFVSQYFEKLSAVAAARFLSISLRKVGPEAAGLVKICFSAVPWTRKRYDPRASEHEETLGIRRLQALSTPAAESLSGYRGTLPLEKVKELTDESAWWLGTHRGALNLYVTELSDFAAEYLSGKKGKIYFLRLKSLTDQAAESLGRHRGGLYFERLESISDAGLHALGNSTGDLHLNCVRALSDSAAIRLGVGRASHGQSLEFGGLTSLSAVAAESLAQPQGKLKLVLSGLREISDTAAVGLGNHKGDLYLGGLSFLSDAAAEGLSKHQGGTLYLDRLRSLSDNAAASLSKHAGGLWLNGVQRLSDAAAESLGKHRGYLHLEGLRKLTVAGARNLGKCSNVVLRPEMKVFLRAARVGAAAAVLSSDD